MHPTRTQPTSTSTGTVVVLREAADYLDAHGWIQGRSYHHTGTGVAASISGAIRHAVTGHAVDDPDTLTFAEIQAISAATVKLAILICTLAHRPIGTTSSVADIVTIWNDTHGRTHTQAVALLRQAADLTEIGNAYITECLTGVTR
jgi:hypothetical protein